MTFDVLQTVPDQITIMVAWHCSELASSAKLGLQLGLDLKL
jgi:hypothetical protein